MYQFKERVDEIGHFWFEKKLIENKNWAALESASKAIYPVIGCHSNELGVAFPGETTIAILSGRTDKIVRKAIIGLEDFPGINIEKYVTKRGRRSKKFILSKHSGEPGSAFPFHRTILEYGNWLHLLPSAQALYPVMRYFGYFDSDIFNLYSEIEDESFDYTNFKGHYPNRQWEFCDAEKDVLAEFAGINKKSIKAALKSLNKNFLIEPYNDDFYDGWKVYLQPFKIYKRDYLNDQVIKKYRHRQKWA